MQTKVEGRYFCHLVYNVTLMLHQISFLNTLRMTEGRCEEVQGKREAVGPTVCHITPDHFIYPMT